MADYIVHLTGGLTDNSVQVSSSNPIEFSADSTLRVVAVQEAPVEFKGSPGPKGDKGDRGDKGDKGDKGDPGGEHPFVYEQLVPASTWSITHTFNREAIASVYINGVQVYTDITVTNTQVVVMFPTPQIGKVIVA